MKLRVGSSVGVVRNSWKKDGNWVMGGKSWSCVWIVGDVMMRYGVEMGGGGLGEIFGNVMGGFVIEDCFVLYLLVCG